MGFDKEKGLWGLNIVYVRIQGELKGLQLLEEVMRVSLKGFCGEIRDGREGQEDDLKCEE